MASKAFWQNLPLASLNPFCFNKWDWMSTMWQTKWLADWLIASDWLNPVHYPPGHTSKLRHTYTYMYTCTDVWGVNWKSTCLSPFYFLYMNWWWYMYTITIHIGLSDSKRSVQSFCTMHWMNTYMYLYTFFPLEFRTPSLRILANIYIIVAVVLNPFFSHG